VPAIGRWLDGEDHDTMHNSEASLEVHELKNELGEEELKNVFGGKASFHDLSFTHRRTRLRQS